MKFDQIAGGVVLSNASFSDSKEVWLKFKRTSFRENVYCFAAEGCFHTFTPHINIHMEAKIIELLTKLKTQNILFTEVIVFIDQETEHTPTAFKNGEVYNEATENQGSAKVFRFAHDHKLSKEDTLLLFAEHYESVLADPVGTNHQNIRQFMIHGWEGIKF